MLLSLDISTSSTGYSIFDEKGSLLEIDYIGLSKVKCMYEKANKVRLKLIELKEKYNIDYIAVEENLQAFRPGLSSAKTLMTLARFNGIVCWICFELFSKKVEYLNVNNARKSVDLKVDRKSKLNTKDQVKEWVKLKEPNIVWPTKILKSGPNKGKKVELSECYDMADSYVIGKAYFAM